MKNLLFKLLLLMLAVTLVFGLAACDKDSGDGTGDGTSDGTGNGTGDGTGAGTGDGTGSGAGDGGSEGTGSNLGDDKKLILVKDGVANFNVVTTAELDEASAALVAGFITELRGYGVEVGNSISDANAGKVTECEIIFGTGVANRDEKYAVSAIELGYEGYVVKVVDNKVVVAGGSPEMTAIAIEKFIADVMAIDETTEEVDDVDVRRTYSKIEKTRYLISSITVADTDFSEYTIVYDFNGYDEIYDFSAKGFREDIFKNSGYWLDIGTLENAGNYEHKVIFRTVEECGEDGFRAYVDTAGDFIMECAYPNGFNKAYQEIMTELIFEDMGDVEISKKYDETVHISTVKYSDFGAVGDGRTDDWEAIHNTHVYANQCGQKVYGDAGATYFIHAYPVTTEIKTDVDFNGATFYMDDRGSEVYETRDIYLFTLARDHEGRVLSSKEIAADPVLSQVVLKTTDKKLDWLVPYLEAESYVRFTNNHKDFIRHGGNINSGNNRTDIVIVDADGTLHDDTPLIYDFEAGMQILNTGLKLEMLKTSNFTKIEIYRTDDHEITVENGVFLREGCHVVPETEMNNKYHAYRRGFCISRSNATVRDLRHQMLSEPDLPTTGYGEDDNGKMSQSYPYYGFLLFMGAYNIDIIDCDLTGHTTYYEDKSASSATPVPMGTYDIVVEYSSNIYCYGITNGVDIADSQYWGIMSSNGSKNMTFENCSMSRFDAHRGFWNANLIDCEFGQHINVVGGGNLYMKNVRKVVGGNYISLRGDYGSTFNGNITMIDCRHEGKATYRGGATDPDYFNVVDSITLISAGFSSNYKGQYVEGNAGAFPYLKWDFGYVCYMPRNVVVDNFTTPSTATVYMFNDLGNAMFEKPADFIDPMDYEGKFIPDGSATGRPMTANDVYYNQYQLTESITYKNMKALPTCPSDTCTVLRGVPVTVIED